MPIINYENIAKESLTAEIYSVCGKVVAISRSNQTHVHASGGGAYASSHQGHATASVAPIKITSSNSVHDDVHLITEAGEEIFLQLVNWENAGIREGHTIQAIWLNITSSKPAKATPYLVINNRSLGKVLYNQQGLSNAVRPTSFTKSLTAYKNILSTPAKIGLPIFILFCLITIILTPLVVVTAVGMRHFLEKKLPEVAQRDLVPKINNFVLPKVS